MRRPRLVFMGTPEFAVQSLAGCLEIAEVVAVVTQPDKPVGRGQALAFPPVKRFALEHGLPVFQPPRMKGMGFDRELLVLQPEVAVVAAYGRILPPEVLAVPSRGCVNVHASLLPRFRGAAPIQWAIAFGDARSGVCLMQMEAGLDTGPVLACEEVELTATETSQSLHDRLAEVGRRLLIEQLPLYLAGQLIARPQSEEGMVLAPMIRKEEGRLDFARPAVELERRLRAFTPWPGAFTHFRGQLLKVKAARVGEGKGAPGEILGASPEGITVACGTGALVVLELQLEGKRTMSAKEFLAGRPMEVGSTPFTSGGA